ncbi:MAG: isoleucine--tRNA ligase [Candidatus Hydrothermales bacterium]
MKASLKEREPEILKLWEEKRIYYKILEEERPIFILHDGPPYSNGHIHIGTAMNKILKDFIIKSRIIMGYKTPYIPGWDNHGMPIENEVIKEDKEIRDILQKDPLALRRDDVRKNLRKKCENFARKWMNIQREEFKRLLCIGDWNNPYFTMHPEYEAEELRIFAKLVEKGFIEKGFMPLHFCPVCKTVLAMAEIEYKNRNSPSIYFLMDPLNKEEFPEGTSVLVWTTTPWTIISNVALAFNPNFYYGIIEFDGKKYLLALETLERVKEELKLNKFEIIKEFSGKELEYKKFLHPFYKRESLAVLAEFVERETGSGIVHIAPGHGKEDFEVGQKYNLPVLSPIDDLGKFTRDAEGFEGMDTEEASKKVVEILKEKGKLLKESYITHSYPHCWRCKSPLIFRATEQWFLRVDHLNLRKKALKEIENVKWIPAPSKQSIYNAVLERPDWCISRQRAWGLPIPAFKCRTCSKSFIDHKYVYELANLVQKSGAQIFWEENEIPLPKCPNCKSSDLEKERDVLDVWIDSGVTSLVVLKNKNYPWPCDVFIEGPDQHRGWFNASLMISVAIEEKAPYKTVITHGWTLDEQGRAMHKSLGNVVSPLEVIEKYGSEILRVWTAFSEYTQDVRISDNILNLMVDSYRKIRNTYRFILGNLFDFDPKKNIVKIEDMLPLDRYMLIKTDELKEKIVEFYEEYAFHRAFHLYHKFCNVDLSSFYLDILKDRLYTFYFDSKERRSAQSALYYILLELLKMGAPILSFTCEEAYQNLKFKEKESIFHEILNKERKHKDENLLVEFDKIIRLRDVVLKLLEEIRTSKKIGSSLEAEVYLEGNDEVLERYFEYLPEIFIVSLVGKGKPKNYEVSDKFEKLKIYVKRSEGAKCERCWRYLEEVKLNKNGVCKRCEEALIKSGILL